MLPLHLAYFGSPFTDDSRSGLWVIILNERRAGMAVAWFSEV